jgi:hypothetical protein
VFHWGLGAVPVFTPQRRQTPPARSQAFVFEHSALQRGTARFFNQELFSDVVLVAPGGRRMKCHRVLLAVRTRPTP